MPTYVYKCKDCEHQFEKVQKMSDDPICECPECNGTVSRLLFAPGIVFKGSGFHINDYPSSSSANTSSAPKSDSACSSCCKAESGCEMKN
ncbi:MAG: FmdB family zinc ribbon protein [Armatimonadota bacterium]